MAAILKRPSAPSFVTRIARLLSSRNGMFFVMPLSNTGKENLGIGCCIRAFICSNDLRERIASEFYTPKSQLPVIEQALETASMMLGSDKSRGYMLEMICADFLAGANAEEGDPDALLLSLNRFFGLLPELKKKEFLIEAGT